MATQQRLAIAALLSDIESTTTKAGWCLQKGLEHVCQDPKVLDLVQQHGVPTFYECVNHKKVGRHAPTQNMKDPENGFESLCRIIVGQCVAGPAATAIYGRLLEASNHALTPQTVLDMFKNNNTKEQRRKHVGLSKSKLNSILDLSHHFANGRLSEEFLTMSTTDNVRAALLQVKGVGPWSIDMFLQFYLEHSNILPLGDLGVRKGIQTWLRLSDHKRIQAHFEKKYAPYQSLVTYYMWRVADSPKKQKKRAPKRKETTTTTTPLSPDVKKRQGVGKVVTP